MIKIFMSVLVGIFLLALPVAAQYNMLYELTDAITSNGIRDLVLSCSTLYSAIFQDGANRIGTLSKVQSDGTGFTILHDFAGGTADGNNSRGNLIASGSTIFGLTHCFRKNVH